MEKRKGFPKTAATLVTLGGVATFVLFVLHRGIERLDILDSEFAAMATMVVVLVGTVLGFISWKSGGGKLAGILGLLILGFYVYVLLASDSPSSPAPGPDRLYLPKEAQTQPESRTLSAPLPLDSQKQSQLKQTGFEKPEGLTDGSRRRKPPENGMLENSPEGAPEM